MRVDVISVMPRYFDGILNQGIIKIAQSKALAEVVIHNLHDYGLGNYKQVDDSPFGGGAGMILMCEPVFSVIEKLVSERSYDDVIYLTPDGEKLSQPVCNSLSLKKNILVLCGHYKGIDERIRKRLITKEISIGDYVLTGGEPAAIILLDAVIRLLPGVMTDSESALLDSFQHGLLDCEHYTRPAVYRDMSVPEILLSGHHKKIMEWRHNNALQRTLERRPDLLNNTSDENRREI